MKQKVIAEINKHREEIEKLMRSVDSYLYLVVHNDKDLKGADWHSPNDYADSLEYIFEEMNTNELVIGVRYPTSITEDDWKDIKSWYLELWENDMYEDDRLVKTWKGNIDTENDMETENYGFIGIVNADCAKWDYFKQEPKHLRNVYKLTEDGFDVFHSWNEEGGYEDYDDMAILQILTEDDTLSKKIGHFVYD